MWLSPFTCPQPLRCVLCPWSPPHHTLVCWPWYPLTIQPACPSGTWTNQQLISRHKNGFRLGWLIALAGCAGRTRTGCAGVWCTELLPKATFQCDLAAGAAAPQQMCSELSQYGLTQQGPAQASRCFTNPNKKPGQGLQEIQTKLQADVHEQTAFLLKAMTFRTKLSSC